MKNIIKIIALVLAFGILFVGCNKNDTEDLVTIGNYTGFKITKYDTTVTEEDINNAISQFLSENKYNEDITDRPAAEGDIVVIDFKGMIDGVAFEGGTATDYEISSLCSGGFIDGFEEAIVGKNPGESFSADLKFPDPYPNNPDYAGKPVTFEYTLKAIKKSVIPEYTDKTVSQYAGYETTEEYEEHLRTFIASEKEAIGLENQSAELWQQLLDVCEVNEYPQDKIDDAIKEMKSYFEMYAEMLQISYAELIENYTTLGTVEDAEKYMLEEAQYMVKGTLVIEAVVKENNLTYTEDEYNNFIKSFADANGITVDEVVTNYPEDELREAVCYEKVIEHLRESAVEVEPTTEK